MRALSPIFRAKFRDAIASAGLADEIDAEVWAVDWNVNCQAVGDGEASLEYLSRYVFKVGISEGRIVTADELKVVFKYRKVNSSRERTLTLSPEEFIRRFLQHVLPTGFMKVRYFGFLSPSFAMPIEEVKGRIEMAHGFTVRAAPVVPDVVEPQPRGKGCPHCGGKLRLVFRTVAAPLGQPGLDASEGCKECKRGGGCRRCAARGGRSMPVGITFAPTTRFAGSLRSPAGCFCGGCGDGCALPTKSPDIRLPGK